MTTAPKPSALWRTDPDDTEGRAMYRNAANALAARQLAYEKRWVRLKALTNHSDHTTKDDPETAKEGE